MKIFGLFDKKAEVFTAICEHSNEETYKRSLFSFVNNNAPTNNLHHHAFDYELHLLGQFDDHSGLITPEKKFICYAADLLRKE